MVVYEINCIRIESITFSIDSFEEIRGPFDRFTTDALIVFIRGLKLRIKVTFKKAQWVLVKSGVAIHYKVYQRLTLISNLGRCGIFSFLLITLHRILA